MPTDIARIHAAMDAGIAAGRDWLRAAVDICADIRKPHRPGRDPAFELRSNASPGHDPAYDWCVQAHTLRMLQIDAYGYAVCVWPMPAASASSSALSVFSQVNSGSLRPKWPPAAV